jgi:hypothetical protein
MRRRRAHGEIAHKASAFAGVFNPVQQDQSLVRTAIFLTYIGSVSEAVIVQADAAGQPQVLVTMSRSGVALGGRVVVGFPSSREAWNNPVAVMLLIDTNQPPVVAALPVNNSGEPYTQAVGVRWNRSRAAYELISGGK